MTEQTTEAPETQEAPQVGLSLQDIANALQIIDIAVSRGAIRGEETSSVGMVRDRLAAFLAANQQQQAAEVDSDTPDEAEEASE
jgi:hypothetical protein